jgi:hypothetical protein
MRSGGDGEGGPAPGLGPDAATRYSLTMRRLALSLAGLALLALPSAAAARSYYVIQSGGDGWTVMDPDSVEAVPGSAVKKAWAVRVQRNILSGSPPQPGYVRTLSEYDCAVHRVRWREFSAFSRSGKLLVSKVNPQPEWGPATEDSDTDAAYRVVCEGAGGGSLVSADSVAKVVISLMGSWDPPASVAPTVPNPAPSVKPAAASASAKAAPKRK